MTPTGRDLKGGYAGHVWWPLAGLLLILSPPFLLTEFYLDLLGVMLIRGLLALSFNLLYGFGGRLSFGHGAFLGTGAYVISILLTRTEVPFPLAFLAAIVGSTLVAAFVGYFCVRFLSFYFSIMTLAFSQLLFLVVDKWYAVTGGDDGIQRIFPPDPISGTTAQYYYVLILSSVAAVALWWVVRSPYGSVLRAIRDNRRRAEFIGIDVSRYEWAAFVISGAFAGVAGALLAPFNQSVSPHLLHWTKSAEPVFMSALGGPYFFWGPLLGAAIFSILESTIPDLLFEAWPLVLGTILVSVVLFFPEGVAEILWKSKDPDRGDATQFMAPMAYEFDWPLDDWNLVAKGLGIGHLMECAAQLSGGYYADPGWKEVPHPEHIGFPIAEVQANGDATITKLPGTGGEVSERTCTEQLLYELHDPANYKHNDGIVDFTTTEFKQVGPDRVSVTGTTGHPKPPTVKIFLGGLEGFVAVGRVCYGGTGAYARARLAADVIVKRMTSVHGVPESDLRVDFIGVNALYPWETGIDPSLLKEVELRLAIYSEARDKAEELLHEVEKIATNGPAAVSLGLRLDYQSGPDRVVGLYTTFLPQEMVKYDAHEFVVE